MIEGYKNLYGVPMSHGCAGSNIKIMTSSDIKIGNVMNKHNKPILKRCCKIIFHEDILSMNDFDKFKDELILFTSERNWL